MDIKQQQREVIESTNQMFREIYIDIIADTNSDWIRKHFRDFHHYIVERLKQQTKLWKRKSMDNDIKLIELSRLRLEIKNKIEEVRKMIWELNNKEINEV